jgi:hypothetical protein
MRSRTQTPKKAADSGAGLRERAARHDAGRADETRRQPRRLTRDASSSPERTPPHLQNVSEGRAAERPLFTREGGEPGRMSCGRSLKARSARRLRRQVVVRNRAWRASSWPATCAMARSSASLRRLAKGRWPSRSSKKAGLALERPLPRATPPRQIRTREQKPRPSTSSQLSTVAISGSPPVKTNRAVDVDRLVAAGPRDLDLRQVRRPTSSNEPSVRADADPPHLPQPARPDIPHGGALA